MKRYKIPKGTICYKKNGSTLRRDMTTKNAYYTDVDVVNEGYIYHYAFRVPDAEWPMVKVFKSDVVIEMD